ncbi:kinase-like domain-containing protein [Naematelia encephala]|uniref:Kinase-like domain-containing protein n=1 Tax=Naematelia encephala TaxID=71784 RepID=A0A1Y2AR48_9TREE|nr:kinase-like domain-containing protein [Naematelia encephala]
MPSNTFATSGRDLVGHCIDNGRLEFLSVLGLGAYGVVYLAVDLHAPKPVYLAVKCLLRAGLDSRQRHFQRREIALHQLASRHPNVVTMHKVFEEGDYIFVVMDFCDEGDLFGMITERQRYLGNDHLIKKVFLQIVDAVEYCHSMGIFHRDLKPENILCTRDGERICIADFGLATSERMSTDFGCGSTFYLSPECQGGLFERLDHYSTEHNDLWSLGVILVNLTCGRNPWRQACPSDETFRAFVHNPDFLRTILPISHATNNILRGLFALEPRERTSLRELRRQILAIDTFTMTEDELRTAHSAARAAAAAVRPVHAVAPPQPQPALKIQVQVSAMDLDPVNDVRVISPRVWSDESGFAEFEASIEPSVFAQIDFTPAAPNAHAQHYRQVPTPCETPGLVDGHQDPCEMATTSSRSSSSGDASPISTPEFRPVDAHTVVRNIPAWGTKGKAAPPQPDLLHVQQPISPLSPTFQLI